MLRALAFLTIVATGCRTIFGVGDPVLGDGQTGGGDSGSGKWSVVQVKGSMLSSTAAISASGAGHLLVAAVQNDSTTTVTSVTDDAGNVYVSIPTARSTNMQPSEGIEMWYAADTHAGATRVTANGPQNPVLVVWELSGLAATQPLDVAAAVNDGPGIANPSGPSITTRQPGEAIIAVIVLGGQVSGTTPMSGFTNDLTQNGNGWAHLTNASAPAGTYVPQWTVSMPGKYCSSAAAFVAAP